MWSSNQSRSAGVTLNRRKLWRNLVDLIDSRSSIAGLSSASENRRRPQQSQVKFSDRPAAPLVVM